ncbi:MAG TPA: efflux RND transporter periplasmic adaptor subunit [Chthoniobacterales bacterium]
MLRLILAFVAMLVAMALLIGGLAYFKVNQIMGFIKLAQSGAFAPPPSAVTTQVVQAGFWDSNFQAVGTVAPVEGVTLSTELEGIVDAILFESGTHRKRGDLLVQLDASQEKAQLAQAVAHRELSRLTLDRDRDLLAKHTIAKSEFDAAEADYRQSQANVDLYNATIDQKNIRAPFDGVVGIRQVDRGQYVSPGQPMVSFQSFNPVYVNFYIPQRDLGRVHPHQPVRIRVDGLPDQELVGEVTALNSQVDPNLRNVQVQATLPNPSEIVRPGAYVNVTLELAEAKEVLAIPASAVDYSLTGTAVFVLTDAKGKDGKPGKAVRRQPVTLGPGEGDQVVVTSGLKRGDEIITAGAFRLRDGAAVVVNNSVRPENDRKPTPADS